MTVRAAFAEPLRPWRRWDSTFKVFGSFSADYMSATETRNGGPAGTIVDATHGYNAQLAYFDLFLPNVNGSGAATSTTRPWRSTTGGTTAIQISNAWTDIHTGNPKAIFGGYLLTGGVVSDSDVAAVSAACGQDVWFRGGSPYSVAVASRTSNTLTFADAHGLTVDDQVKFSGTTAPAPLVLGTTYYVKTVPESRQATFAATAGGATITLTNQGSAAVMTRQNYALNEVVRPSTDNDFLYICISAGSVSGSEPTWPTVRRNSVSNGGVTWQEYEPGIYGVPILTGAGNNYRVPKGWPQAYKNWLAAMYRGQYDLYAYSDNGLSFLLADVMGAARSHPPPSTWLKPQPYVELASYRKTSWNTEADEFMVGSRDLAAFMAGSLSQYKAGLEFGVNAIDDGESYLGQNGTSATSVIIDGCRYGFTEQFMRGSSQESGVVLQAADGTPNTSYLTAAYIRASIDALIQAGNAGKVLLCNTALWPNTQAVTGGVYMNDSVSKQWHKLSYATFIIGNTSGWAYFQFRDDNSNNTAASQAAYNADNRADRHHQFAHYYYSPSDIWWDRLDGYNGQVGLGTPTDYWTSAAAAEITPAVWRRRFTNGFCIVNRQASAYSYNAGADGMPNGTYTSIDGVTSFVVAGGAGSVTIGDKAGDIFRKTA